MIVMIWTSKAYLISTFPEFIFILFKQVLCRQVYSQIPSMKVLKPPHHVWYSSELLSLTFYNMFDIRPFCSNNNTVVGSEPTLLKRTSCNENPLPTGCKALIKSVPTLSTQKQVYDISDSAISIINEAVRFIT